VSIFIVISGLSLMLGVLADPQLKIRGGFKGYILRRAKRIMPPYYAALAASLIFLLVGQQFFPVATATAVASGLRADTIGAHLLLIHTLNPATGVSPPNGRSISCCHYYCCRSIADLVRSSWLVSAWAWA
jgi:peptidoglycan/LPS O-acetylase OafA/YrhL